MTRFDLYRLDLACRVLLEGFPNAIGVYHVGSSLTKKTYRDVDVRLVLLEEDFDRIPKEVHILLGILGTGYLSNMTGLPIDFQIQCFDKNTRKEEKENGTVSNPLGLRTLNDWIGELKDSEGEK